MPTVFDSADAILAAVGQTLGESQWVTITQERINRFADATDDHQWIHVDAERAKDGPFGAPIAHGFLSLSLTVKFWSELFDLDEAFVTSTTQGVMPVSEIDGRVIGSSRRGRALEPGPSPDRPAKSHAGSPPPSHSAQM